MFKTYLFHMLLTFNINHNVHCTQLVFVQNSDFVRREFYHNVETYNHISTGVLSLVSVSILLFFNISNYVLVKMSVKIYIKTRLIMNTCYILCSPLIRKKDCVPMKMLQRKLCLAMEAGQVGKCSFMFVFNYMDIILYIPV